MIRRLVGGLALTALLAAPAWAGIEEHSPEPSPDSELYSGFVMGRSLEGLQIHEDDEEPAPATTVKAWDTSVVAPAVDAELQMQWMFAQVGVLYEPHHEPSMGQVPHQLPTDDRPDEVREPGRQPESDHPDPTLDSASGALGADDEAAAGCSSTGALPSAPHAFGVAGLLLAFAALTRIRRPARQGR